MNEHDLLAERFEAQRSHLRAVAYRMLGSLSEADDAVQEAWVRMSRTDTTSIDNLGGFLTTVVARVCLDMLRSRKARREAPLDTAGAGPGPDATAPSYVSVSGPEQEAVWADSVGLALLVVLETLAPAERLAFVLHDLFGVSFDEIADIVGRTPEAARQLASRARRRVQGTPKVSEAELKEQRPVVDAFLAALRGGDMAALMNVLDPDLVVRAEVAPGQTREIRSAKKWVKGAVVFAQMAAPTRAALVDGALGVILAPNGKLTRALRVTIVHGKITELEVIMDPARLERLEVSLLDGDAT